MWVSAARREKKVSSQCQEKLNKQKKTYIITNKEYQTTMYRQSGMNRINIAILFSHVFAISAQPIWQ